MKYSRKKIDFSLNYILLIHIPKTGCISIRSSFKDVLDQSAFLKLRDDRINEINKSRLQKYHRRLKRRLAIIRQNLLEDIKQIHVTARAMKLSSLYTAILH